VGVGKAARRRIGAHSSPRMAAAAEDLATLATVTTDWHRATGGTSSGSLSPLHSPPGRATARPRLVGAAARLGIPTGGTGDGGAAAGGLALAAPPMPPLSMGSALPSTAALLAYQSAATSPLPPLRVHAGRGRGAAFHPGRPHMPLAFLSPNPLTSPQPSPAPAELTPFVMAQQPPPGGGGGGGGGGGVDWSQHSAGVGGSGAVGLPPTTLPAVDGAFSFAANAAGAGGGRAGGTHHSGARTVPAATFTGPARKQGHQPPPNLPPLHLHGAPQPPRASAPWPSPTGSLATAGATLPSPALVSGLHAHSARGGHGGGVSVGGGGGGGHTFFPATSQPAGGGGGVIGATADGDADRWLAPPTVDPTRGRGFSIDAFATGLAGSDGKASSGAPSNASAAPGAPEGPLAGASAHGFEIGGGDGGGSGAPGSGGHDDGAATRSLVASLPSAAAGWARERANSLASPTLEGGVTPRAGDGDADHGHASHRVAHDRPSPLALVGATFDSPSAAVKAAAAGGPTQHVSRRDSISGTGAGGNGGGGEASSRASTVTVPAHAHAPSSTF
jgi:hypothetical protein